jgi:hypothetical protein
VENVQERMTSILITIGKKRKKVLEMVDNKKVQVESLTQDIL